MNTLMFLLSYVLVVVCAVLTTLLVIRKLWFTASFLLVIALVNLVLIMNWEK